MGKTVCRATCLMTVISLRNPWAKQRKHYYNNAMPDTWSKDTFPLGHGKDSLLGVRFNDAQAFCRWLTERDRESYRLPRQEEDQQIRTSVGAGLPKDTSYWEEEGTFVWSPASPSWSLQEGVLMTLSYNHAAFARPGTISVARANTIISSLTSGLTSTIASLSEGAGALARAHAIIRTITRTNGFTDALAGEVAGALASTRTSTLTFARSLGASSACASSLARALDTTLASTLIRDLYTASTSASALTSELSHTLANAHNFTGTLANARGLTSTLARDLDNALNLTSTLAHDLDNALTSARIDAIEVYIITFLLVQRPNGMLPVYEGILLIKEPKSEASHTSKN